MQKLLIILSFIISWQASAAIQLNVSMISKRGIDEKLVLVSELHSSEIVISGEWVRLEMKDGPILFVRVSHYEDLTAYGPSDLLKIEGQLASKNSLDRRLISSSDIIVKIGEEKQIILKPVPDQQLDLIFTPKMVP